MTEVVASSNLARCERTRNGGNWSTDAEILGEVAEELGAVGDVQACTITIDRVRHQISARLQDGARLLVTVRIER